jgi:protein O-mannosyl-transferase
VLRTAAELNPASPMVHFQLGVAFGMGRLTGEAAPEYREALRLRPDWPEALNNLAWILATEADGNRRDGPEAVRLAARACELTAWQQTRYAGTLAVAYAEAGQFDQAVEMAQKTCDLAAARGETSLAKNTQVLLELFRSRKPYHESK